MICPCSGSTPSPTYCIPGNSGGLFAAVNVCVNCRAVEPESGDDVCDWVDGADEDDCAAGWLVVAPLLTGVVADTLELGGAVNDSDARTVPVCALSGVPGTDGASEKSTPSKMFSVV